nr:hypothetical protein [Tanacetum cinerariifolium]
MKDVFKELEAEVAQCAVDRKHDAIDRKNLLIANDNLIAECLSKEVFSVAIKSELNVARFAKMNQAIVQDDRVLVQNVQGQPNRGQGMNPWGRNEVGYGEAKNRARNVNQGQTRLGQARTVKCYNCNGGMDNAFDDDVDEQPIQDLALNVDNVFQAEECDAFDSDVDEAPTAQTMFMANLSSADHITDEAGPSYDSDILSEVQDHDQYLDDTCAYQEEHVMHGSVQLDHVVDLHADHTSISNMIMYD